MNAAHLHITLVHISIIALPLLAIFFMLARLRNDNFLSALCLFCVLVVAGVTVPAYLAGEGAEEIIEEISGIHEEDIETHEEAAEKAFISLLITGGLALIQLIYFFSKKAFFSILNGLLLISMLITIALLFWSANLGGKIRHQEINIH